MIYNREQIACSLFLGRSSDDWYQMASDGESLQDAGEHKSLPAQLWLTTIGQPCWIAANCLVHFLEEKAEENGYLRRQLAHIRWHFVDKKCRFTYPITFKNRS